MEIKTFEERKKEARESASLGLEQLKKEGVELPNESSKLEDILDHTHDYVENNVRNIANTVASIKDVGLGAHEPVVTDWVEKELEVTPQEFDEFLKSTETGEEAKIGILEEMDVPKAIIEDVKNEAGPSKKLK